MPKIDYQDAEVARQIEQVRADMPEALESGIEWLRRVDLETLSRVNDTIAAMTKTDTEEPSFFLSTNMAGAIGVLAYIGMAVLHEANREGRTR